MPHYLASRLRRWVLLCLTLFALFNTVSNTASAALISYSLGICENLDVLLNPNNAAIQQQAVQTTVQSLILARDMPYFKLTNTSMDPLAALTSFRLTIPANRPNDFDYVSWISASPGVSYTLNQPDLVNNGLHSKFIDITFSGLTAGKSVIFRSDIDWTFGDTNYQTDYRTVLFNANSTGPITNNALVDVGFNNNPVLTSSVNLPNFQSNGTIYTCICFRNPALVDHVMTYSLAQVIPEPGPFAAGAVMLLGACWWWRRMKQLVRE
jgi:hypothetical protein